MYTKLPSSILHLELFIKLATKTKFLSQEFVEEIVSVSKENLSFTSNFLESNSPTQKLREMKENGMGLNFRIPDNMDVTKDFEYLEDKNFKILIRCVFDHQIFRISDILLEKNISEQEALQKITPLILELHENSFKIVSSLDLHNKKPQLNPK